MTAFSMVLPGLSPAEVEEFAARGSSDELELAVRDGLVRARVRYARSATPVLRGRLSSHPDGTVLAGDLSFRRSWAFVALYGALTAACATLAGLAAADERWSSFAILAVGAITLLFVTWLSLHAGVAHQDDDADWLRARIAAYYDLAGGTLEE